MRKDIVHCCLTVGYFALAPCWEDITGPTRPRGKLSGHAGSRQVGPTNLREKAILLFPTSLHTYIKVQTLHIHSDLSPPRAQWVVLEGKMEGRWGNQSLRYLPPAAFLSNGQWEKFERRDIRMTPGAERPAWLCNYSSTFCIWAWYSVARSS